MTAFAAWLPLVFFLLGLLIFVGCSVWADRQGGGMLSGFFEGLMGLAACLICWAIAGGLLVGRWLA